VHQEFAQVRLALSVGRTHSLQELASSTAQHDLLFDHLVQLFARLVLLYFDVLSAARGEERVSGQEREEKDR
jgi:hypothetical protein